MHLGYKVAMVTVGIAILAILHHNVLDIFAAMLIGIAVGWSS